MSNPLNLVREVPMELTVVLGTTVLPLRDIVELTPGSVVPLDHIADTPVDVLANGVLIARGEVMVQDENYAIRITEVVDGEAS
jgi:flagellar motor switch protein FliN/FliY